MQNDRPTRVFHLRGGGRISAELVRFTEEQITIDFHGNRLTLPLRAVLAIDPFLGERQVFSEGFDGPKISSRWKTTGDVKLSRLDDRPAVHVLPNGSLRCALETPLPAFRWSAAFFDPLPENASAGIELRFGDGHSLTVSLASSDPFYSVQHSSGLRLRKQTIRRNPGWRRLTVLCDGIRFHVLIDSKLLASGRPHEFPLKAVRFFSLPSQNADRNAFWIDDVLLSELVPRMESLKTISIDKPSQVLLASGDLLFGHITGIDADRVLLAGAFGETRLPWGQVRRIVFPEAHSPAASSPLEKSPPLGWVVDVTFHRFVDHPYLPADRLSATLLKSDAKALEVHHPRLGTIQIPWDQVDVIEPRFLGQSLVLSPDIRHLGNQLKPEFRGKTPLGTEWRGEFSLEKVWAGPAFLRIDVAELEPAGPETPPGSRYLSELRSGQLGTEVLLNEKSLGRLNDLISRRSLRESPQTLRLPIPAAFMRAGQNTWRIEQAPLRKAGKEFDDCELGPVVLEREVLVNEE